MQFINGLNESHYQLIGLFLWLFKKKDKGLWDSMSLLQLKPRPLLSRIKDLIAMVIKVATMERISKEILEKAYHYTVIVANLDI